MSQQFRQLGPKDVVSFGLAHSTQENHTVSQANLPDPVPPAQGNIAVIKQSTAINKGIDYKTHEALLQLITELEELLEDE